MTTPRHTDSSALPLTDHEPVYQLVKRADIVAADVEDATAHAVEVTVLWQRAVLHVAHLDPAEGFTLTASAPKRSEAMPAVAPGLAVGAALMLTGASMGAHGNLAVAGAGALASAAALGVGVALHRRDEGRASDPTRFVVDAGVLGCDALPVIARDGEGARFVVPAGATGEVEIDGARRELADLVAAGIARPSATTPGAHEINVVPGGRYRMELAGLTFQARLVARGRVVAGATKRDTTMRVAWVASAMAAAAVLGALRLASTDSAMLVGEDHDARLAELRDFVMRQREQVTQQEEAREAAAAASAPAGAAHQGAAGSMGDRQSRAHNRRYEIRATGERPHLARERSAREAVSARGIFLALGGPAAVTGGAHSGIVSPFGEMTEAGTGARDANGNLDGADVGDSFGMAGLDTVGTGFGGGGHDVGVGTGPLGTQGHGNCRPGEDCRFGQTVGTRLGPRENHGPTVRPRAPEIEGTIAPEAIRRVVLRNLGQVNRCYEQGLAQNPNAAGRVSVRFVVAGGGTVLATGVVEDGLGIPSVANCISLAVRRWTFPVPESSGPVTVTYPFSLMPAD